MLSHKNKQILKLIHLIPQLAPTEFLAFVKSLGVKTVEFKDLDENKQVTPRPMEDIMDDVIDAFAKQGNGNRKAILKAVEAAGGDKNGPTTEHTEA